MSDRAGLARVGPLSEGRVSMATSDVPGTNAKNRDELAIGCWAERATEVEPAPDRDDPDYIPF